MVVTSWSAYYLSQYWLLWGVTGIDRKVFSRAFRSRWDRENRWRIGGDMAEWSLWQSYTSVFKYYFSNTWTGLGSSRVFLCSLGVEIELSPYTRGKRGLEQWPPDTICYDLAKQLSYYLYFFSFLFLFFYLGLTTQKEVQESVMSQVSHSHSHSITSHDITW